MNYAELQAEYKLIDLYCAYLKDKGRAYHTISTRRSSLRFTAKSIGLNADPETMRKWLFRKPLLPKSIVCGIADVRQFFTWAVENGYAEYNPTAGLKPPSLPHKTPKPIPEKELEYLLSKANPKFKVWILLGAFAGLKCQEIAALDREDVLDDGWLHIASKQKERIVPMHPAIEKALADYGMPDTGPLFLRHDGSKAHAEDVSQWLRKFMEKVGVESTPTSLRHYFGAQTLRACHDVRVVQELMGHEYLGTTKMYERFDKQAGKQAVASLSLAGI